MAVVNTKRVWIGGLVGGVVWIVWATIVNFGLLMPKYQAAMQAGTMLGEEQARATVDSMEQKVRDSWYEVARRAGVSERDCARIAPAFAYPGFRLR